MNFDSIISTVNGFVWGPYMLTLLVGTGVYLTFRLGLLQIRQLPYALKQAFCENKHKKDIGDISHFQALMTALAATIGTGNIVGVGTAFVVGGPGAIFWMWFAAIFGMATKYAEAVLAIEYRIIDKRGNMAGGPMYYLERGLKAKWLGIIFAVLAVCASYGIGNLTQANSIADAVQSTFGVNTAVTGVVIAVLVAAVILGGIRSIAKVSGIVVPFMAVIYILTGLVVLVVNFDLIIPALTAIFSDAFTGHAAAGGALGTVIRFGIARGVFSNEAGLGSAPIAAAAAKTDHPGRQGLVSMTGTFIDTIIVCSITGTVLTIATIDPISAKAVVGLDGAARTLTSFHYLVPFGVGKYIVTIGLMFFAYTTILGWSYYGDRCFEYLFGLKRVKWYRWSFVVAAFFGAIAKLQVVWNIADTLNGAMAIPNLIGLLLLSNVVVRLAKEFNVIKKKEKAYQNHTAAS
jgi:alanine or glycine:cation symporter, AGCS family